MYKIILITIISILLSIQSVYAQSLHLKSISEDLQEVVLIHRDTGTEWIAREGDVVEGWSIVAIKKNRVVIRKAIEGEKHQAIVRILTLPKKLGIMPVQSE